MMYLSILAIVEDSNQTVGEDGWKTVNYHNFYYGRWRITLLRRNVDEDRAAERGDCCPDCFGGGLDLLLGIVLVGQHPQHTRRSGARRRRHDALLTGDAQLGDAFITIVVHP